MSSATPSAASGWEVVRRFIELYAEDSAEEKRALAALTALESAARGLAEERDRLRTFAEDMIETTCWGRYSDDIDGGDLQDAASKAGVLVEIPGGFDPEKHHDVSGCAEPGDRWFTFAWSEDPALSAYDAAAGTTEETNAD